MDSKALTGVEIKSQTKGEVAAVFSTFGVADHDGDVTPADAFDNGAKVLISAYNHQSWQGAMPVGKGTIRVGSKEAVMEGAFFMNTTHGRDAFETVKEVGDLQEWSYGFDVLDAGETEIEGKSYRLLKKLKVYEVSPVIRGAGIGTYTQSVKRTFTEEERQRMADNGQAMPDGSFPIANEQDLHNAIQAIGRAKDPAAARRHIIRRARALGLTSALPDDWTKMRFAEEGQAVLADLVNFRARAADVMAKRAQKEKGLGDESRALVDQIKAELTALDELLKSEPVDTNTGELTREYLRFIQLTSESR